MVNEKLKKALSNLCSITIRLESEDKRKSIGDLRYCQENIEEAIYLLQAQLEEEANEEAQD